MVHASDDEHERAAYEEQVLQEEQAIDAQREEFDDAPEPRIHPQPPRATESEKQAFAGDDDYDK